MTSPAPTEKQIILAKLTALLEHLAMIEQVPEMSPQIMADLQFDPRLWISNVKALIKRYDPMSVSIKIDIRSDSFDRDYRYRTHLINEIKGFVNDTVEAIRLELELDDRTDIGTAYDSGDVYRYFADIKRIIEGAKSSVFLVDPYLDGKTFDACFATTSNQIAIKILTKSTRYTSEILVYADKHRTQFKTNIEIRQSSELHDRLVVIDSTDCWFSGGSFKDGGKKPTYLIPLGPPIAEDKLRIYDGIWCRASTATLTGTQG